MSKRDVKIETPGDPVDAEQAKGVLLAKQVKEVAKLVGSKDALDWQHLNQAEAVKPGYVPIEDTLPTEDDALTLANESGKPVQSRNGWVLPVNDPRSRIGAR